MFKYILCAVTFLCIFSVPCISEAQINDGFYELDYEVLTGDKTNVSIANDYFEKPAYIIVDGDDNYIQLSINHAHWVVGLAMIEDDSEIDMSVLEENEAEDKRVVQFALSSIEKLDEPIQFEMHIIVDTLDDYDHHYTTYFDMDLHSSVEVSKPLADVAQEDLSTSTAKSDSKVMLWGSIILVGIILGTISLFTFNRKKGRK